MKARLKGKGMGVECEKKDTGEALSGLFPITLHSVQPMVPMVQKKIILETNEIDNYQGPFCSRGLIPSMCKFFKNFPLCGG